MESEDVKKCIQRFNAAYAVSMKHRICPFIRSPNDILQIIFKIDSLGS